MSCDVWTTAYPELPGRQELPVWRELPGFADRRNLPVRSGRAASPRRAGAKRAPNNRGYASRRTPPDNTKSSACQRWQPEQQSIVVSALPVLMREIRGCSRVHSRRGVASHRAAWPFTTARSCASRRKTGKPSLGPSPRGRAIITPTRAMSSLQSSVLPSALTPTVGLLTFSEL